MQSAEQRDGKARIETVNLCEQTCSCGRYQQTQVPCVHAIKAFKLLQLPSAEIFSSGLYFGPITSTLSLRAFYADMNVYANVPADSDVETWNSLNSSSDSLALPAMLSTRHPSSKKRITSNGEKTSSGSVPACSLSSSRYSSCKSCGKYISKKTKHMKSACDKYAEENPSVRDDLEKENSKQQNDYDKKCTTTA